MLRWAFTSVIVLAIAIFLNKKENRELVKRLALAYWKSFTAAFVFLVVFFTLTTLLQ